MFKIEFEPDYSVYKYQLYKKVYRWFGLLHSWERMAAFDSLDKAKAAYEEAKNYPKVLP
jgi:hypothetical protein